MKRRRPHRGQKTSSSIKSSKKSDPVMREIPIEEDDQECYVLQTVPTNLHFSCNLSPNQSDDLNLIAQKEPVAIRDFPHPRHLCVNFPFNETPHETYCTNCYCYVCESPAPCFQWEGINGHSHVTKSSKKDTLIIHMSP
ncbi:hypothetical protein H6P81_005361 [Aristolochia fimbriata]|uniref:Uncharacterized protein n=1 Tax=Aristolochia fimbriata TaxID=158543 RepID=A0AAV7EXS5_ARIFI|nr:hypothetical protein H6P81_005361 [Aristolochia fimbriata]